MERVNNKPEKPEKNEKINKEELNNSNNNNNNSKEEPGSQKVNIYSNKFRDYEKK